MWTWGSGAQQRGQSLDGRIPGPVPGASSVISVAAGSSHTLALKADGTLLAWGANTEGQLGLNNQIAQAAPVAVSGLINVIAVAAGAASSMALKADGTVWTWGSAHQIGDGQNTRRLIPVQVPGLSDVIAIAAGDVADYVLKGDGTVWSWGDNTNGQIGDGTGGSGLFRLSPVPITALAGVVGIAGGAQHALAVIGSNLSLRSWGLNTSGQIGDGTTGTQRYMPILVSALADVRSVNGAGNRSIAALLDRTVKVWGSAVTATGAGSLVPIGAPGNPLGVQVSGNTNHLMSVTSAGTISTWGLNTSSQLGDGTTIDRRIADTISGDGYAWKVGTPTFSAAAGTYSQVQNVTVATPTAGAVIHYTLDGTDPTETDTQVPGSGVVVVDRTLTLKAAAWKSGSPKSNIASVAYALQAAQPAFSPLGGIFGTPITVGISTASPGAAIHYTTDGSTPTASSPLYTAPVDVGTTLTLKAIATRAGWSDSLLRSVTFTMNFGTLTAPTLTPASGTYESQVVVAMSAQDLSTIRYTTNGSTPTVASTIYDGPVTLNATTTVKAKAFRTDYTTSAETSATYTIVAAAPVISVASGTYAPGTTFTITDSDPAVTIRVTFNGVDPTTSDGAVPSGTRLLVGGFAVKARAFKTGASNSTVASATFVLTQPFGAGSVSAGATHTLLATPAGVVYAWGLGTAGQLGNGGNSNKAMPTVVPTLTGVVSISGGSAHTLAATWDGRVFAWGSNAFGRLGDGTTTSSSVPIEIAGLQNVVSVAAGGSHSLALTADGHVYAWGTGNSGQLGLGSFSNSLTPALIPTLSDIIAIAAGASHSLAVNSAGQLYAWGFNGSSQLGDGGQSAQASPKLITSIAGVSAVSAGVSHSVARLYNGAVYSWGDNTNGQLGLGDTTVRRVPTQIPGLVAVDVVAGGSHGMAIRADGALVAWGANANGQLGDTTTAMRTTPVLVSGLSQVALIAAGMSHSLAVAAGGHIWAWGADSSGQVGDGTTTASRTAPLDVLTASGAWGATPSPMLSVTPGTYGASQTVVVTGAAGAAADMHYTTSGAAPTQNDPLIVSGGSFVIDRSTMLRLRAWAPVRLPSAIVTASYVLQPQVPSIVPGTATYTSAQSVTISTPTPDATLRYTVDGTDPDVSSALYTGPVVIGTFTLLKAKAFRDGWTPSSTATETFMFNYGTVAAPAIAPTGGIYKPGETAIVTAVSGQQIRYTLNGSDPDDTSPPYVSPIVLPDGFVTLKARAFAIDWTPSPVVSQSYVITDDTTPPTITASLSPPPNARGWNNSDVTVTFTCDDLSGVKWCTPPTRVTGEGNGIPVVGSATDVWGNQQSSTFTVNIDRTAPLVHIYDPKDGRHVPPGTASLTVRGGAHDLSGIDSVTCNGIAAVVAGNAFACGVSVVEGTNVITVEADDFAGHSASSHVSVTVGQVIVSALDVSPASLTMVVGDTREIVVKDQEGGESEGHRVGSGSGHSEWHHALESERHV
ncbi:MAG: hypothetical protein DMF87_18790 [Acidobacteria bacterium]|nr:MAG: hypothetical protein DMF87_18790 [Acidobacteriota bacterium]